MAEGGLDGTRQVVVVVKGSARMFMIYNFFVINFFYKWATFFEIDPF
jgi:hypothetical protein